MTPTRILTAAVLAVILAACVWMLVAGRADLRGGATRGVVLDTDAGRAASEPGGAAARAAPVPAVVAMPFRGEADSQPAGSWVVTGRVVDTASLPVRGVKVSLRVIPGSDPGALAEATLEATSVADGGFSLALTPPIAVRSLHAIVVSDVYESSAAPMTVRAGDPPPPPMMVHVTRFTGAIVGTVVDDSGKPLGGATIGSWRHVTAGSDGTYRYPATATSESLSASAPGFAPKRQAVHPPVGGGTVTLDFSLAPEGVVDGVVRREDGTPVAGCAVTGFNEGTPRATTTDAAGAYHMGGFSGEGSFNVIEAAAPGLVPNRGTATFVDRHARVDITLHPGTAVRGEVVAEDGHAISGAKVSIGIVNRVGMRSVFTGTDGRFIVDAVAPGETGIAVAHEKFAPHTAALVVGPLASGPVEMHIVLGAGHYVAGRVVEVGGEVIAGVGVSARRASDNNYLDARVTTDAEGRFRLEGLPAEALSVEVYARGHVRQLKATPVDADDVVITMLRSGCLAGQVVDAATREPVRRFTVRVVAGARKHGERWGGGRLNSAGARQVDVPDGIWRIDDETLDAGGICGIEIRADGFCTGTLQRVVVTTEPDPQANVLALARGSVVGGTVVTARGDAIAHALVSVVDPAQRERSTRDSSWSPMRDAETSATGAFLVTTAVPGECHVLVRAPGLPVHWAGPFRVAAGATLGDVRIVVPDGGAITGIVVGANGAPLAGARVEVQVAGNGPAWAFKTTSVLTGADGRFVLRGLPDGAFTVGLVESDELGTTLARDVAVAGGDTQEVRLAFDGPCAVRVVIEGDAPLPADFMVSVSPAGAGTAGSANRPRMHRSGRVHGTSIDFGGLDAGPHRLWVTGAGSSMDERVFGNGEVTVVPGLPTEVRVRVQRSQPGR